jgi:predicted amino acid dehydrogenase
MAMAAVLQAMEARGLDPTEATWAVIGAGGSVGRLCARLVARLRPRRLVLVGNPKRRPAALAGLRQELVDQGGNVDAAESLDALADSDVIVSASGSTAPILDQAPLSSGTVICDVARPPDSSDRLRRRRDLTILEGGLVALPDSTMRFGAGNLLGLPDGVQLACFAETMLLSLEGDTRDHGIGDDVPVAEVDAMMALARRHGFRPFAPMPLRTNGELVFHNAPAERALGGELPWTP